ncbi:uncharacterized protein LOC126836164 [Adelges cooleyi]|uniref:uncharacterized protein LOC126836164 n=1 Tax=Adelges cooleyi TaxID=133065 RepID=UPI00217F3651|nr:uncharacterized protein LOC126836164 [Adelges cooleyi]
MTIQNVEDPSMPPTDLCNLFLYESQTANNRNSNNISIPRTSSWTKSWVHRNNHSKFNIRATNTCKTPINKSDVRKLLECSFKNEAVTDDHLDVLQKRQALLLITMQTMTLSHHNKVLQNKLDELQKRVLMLGANPKKTAEESDLN